MELGKKRRSTESLLYVLDGVVYAQQTDERDRLITDTQSLAKKWIKIRDEHCRCFATQPATNNFM